MKLKIFGLIIVALAMAACNALENQSTSATRLQIVSLTGNDLKGTAGSARVYSDVLTNGSIFDDPGVADIKALPLDPLLATTAITPYFDVLIDQMDVEFKRPDGRNMEGVDVPYRFTQPMSMLVPINTDMKIPFVLIRHMAKEQAPLLALRANNSQVLQLVAFITIHGKDLGGHRVAPVIGPISVWCSNFADATATTSSFIGIR
jgi:hypothetical protein